MVRNVEFFGAVDDETTEGFNLDDAVTEVNDATTCGHGDLSDKEVDLELIIKSSFGQTSWVPCR